MGHMAWQILTVEDMQGNNCQELGATKKAPPTTFNTYQT